MRRGRIVTVTFNPALDRTVFTDRAFRAGELNRVSHSVVSCGGKGINVSRMLRLLGADTVALGFSGGESGALLKKRLESEGVPFRFAETAAATRTNIKMIDGDGICTELNEAGGTITEDEIDVLLSLIKEETADADIAVMAGSFPQLVKNDVENLLKTVIKELHDSGKTVICDMSGDTLRYAIEAGADLIKPNISELSALVKKELSDINSAVENSSLIYKRTGTEVLCTVGEQGAVYAGKNGVYISDAPRVTVRGFAGAGDSYLAAYLFSVSLGDDTSEAMKLAASAAAAAVECEGTELPEREALYRYKDKINVRGLR